MNAETLAQVLRPLEGMFDPVNYPNLLVGLGQPDDAAIWRLDDRRALVVTTDFFTPVVDDAYDYGAIAAANALSDVYAMGGQPFLALNVAALPPDLPNKVASEILRGGAEIALQAGVVIAGGHTIQDKEPKFGLVVLGFANPQHMITKSGARPGDVLLLSKPLGFGTTTTALKQNKVEKKDLDEVVGWMKRLNKTASELALAFGVRGGTDITGFSLLGHSCEMASASEVGLQLYFHRIPLTRGAQKYAEEFIFPGGASDNRLYFEPQVQFDPAISEASMMLLFDPQTSGGLLLSVPPEQVGGMLESAANKGQPLWQVGEVVKGQGIQVLP
ncbi:MAG: selenide, water dikinase SelD [Anaerolineales bacterium]|jgi:selenide,water dikinase|nr:selenide, water dikinase SelD [Anaerolineales bacterium]